MINVPNNSFKRTAGAVYTTEENCFKIGGFMTDSQKFRASVANDRTDFAA